MFITIVRGVFILRLITPYPTLLAHDSMMPGVYYAVWSVLLTTVSPAKTAEPIEVSSEGRLAYGRHLENIIERSLLGGDVGCR